MGGTHMGTTDNATPRSPSILMIDGREYMLYDEYVGPIKFANITRLWLVAALAWTPVLLLGMGSAMRMGLWESRTAWAILGVVMLLAIGVAIGVAIAALASLAAGPVFITPIAVTEVDRQGTWSTLSIATRRRTVLTVVAHVDMADFLVGSVTGDVGRSAPRHPIPAQLTHPAMRRYVLSSYAALAAVAVVGVAFLVSTAMPILSHTK